ncbi:MAG: NADH-quinone oxidoreductase subunit M [Magnetococcales bacterium]|nr:NADH-quinone oxidoreductase subunit M [Magnetococcales bacterium]MBF0156440.1 NADH-quinone oxidoreductase subunit M [Magnetococcales bacterium]
MPILSLMVALPLVGAVLLVAAGGRVYRLALLMTGLELILAVVAALQVDPAVTGFQLVERHAWIPSLGIHYHVGVDALSALFLPLSALLFGVVVMTSRHHLARPMPGLFFAMLALLEGATMGVFVALDTMFFFLFWELTLVPTYFLVALWGAGPYRRQAATKYTLIMMAGGVPLLFGLLLAALDHPVPLFDLPALLATPLPVSRQTAVFLLLLLGFGVKTPLVPLHTWLATVAMEGPVAAVAIMTGLKLGAYGLLRFAIPIAPEAARSFDWLLVALGVAGILMGGFAALVQTNLRRLLAYASISHVGLVVLGLASFTLQGVQGAVFQLLSFALVSGGLYCLTGFLHQRFGSTDLIHLGGLVRSMPLATALFLFLGLGGLGIPLTAGFPGELLLLLGAAQTHFGAFLAALAGTILGAAAFLVFYRNAFLGPPAHPDLVRGPDLLPHERMALGGVSLILFLGGILPSIILDYTQGAALGWLQGVTRPLP